MQDRQAMILSQWQRRLQALKANYFVATFLEVSGPLNLIGAQLVYFGQPVLRGLVSTDHLNALANLLEDPEAVAQFVQGLKQADRIEEAA